MDATNDNADDTAAVTEMEVSTNLIDTTDIARYFNEETESFLTKLENVWTDMGVDLNELQQKRYDVIQRVKDLFSTIIAEEECTKAARGQVIENYLQELSNLGKLLQIDVSKDYYGYETMTLNNIIKSLREKIHKYREMYTSIIEEAQELQSKEEILCRRLGKEKKALCLNPAPTRDKLNSFKRYLDELSEEIIEREKIFIHAKREIVHIIKVHGISASLNFEKIVIQENENTFILSDENMEQLKTFHASLISQQKDLHSKLYDLREKINTLWERLEESPETRSNFLKTHPGYSIDTYKALKVEEERCKEKIKDNIKMFIDKMRKEVMKWWEQCYYGEEQQKEFYHFDSDCYTEDLLTLYEMYIDKLKKHYEQNESIYALIARRRELWKTLLKLEKKAVNPDRLKNRGGKLLREEKERNSVRATLPKVEKQLLKLIEKYETENNKSFIILGQHMSDLIEKDWDEFKENRHLQLSAKKQARELLRTPLTPRTPLLASPGKTKRTLKSPPNHRLLLTPDISNKNKISAKKVIPKIQITAATINKRVSLERRKRLERKRRPADKNSTKTANSTDYDNFERSLENKTICRSTLELHNKPGPSTLRRTPTSSNLRSKSPFPNRLTPAPGNLPIII